MNAEPLTVEEIIEELSTLKPMSRRNVYENFRVLGIKPVAEVQQRPQLYPPDTAQKILARYGLAPRRLARA
jgi:hypothetical protein